MRASFVLLSLLLLACSSASEGTTTTSSQGGAGGTSALRAFVDRRASAVCDNLGECCQTHGFTYEVHGCHSWLAGQVDPSFGVAEAGATIVDSAIDACVARAVEVAKACVPSSELARAYRDACARVVSGPKMPGDACSLDADCAQPADPTGVAVCRQPLLGTATVCMIRRPAEEGAPCVPSVPFYAECDADAALFCAIGTQTCQKKQPLGSPCIETGGCLEGSYCRGTPAMCVAQAAPGEDCGGYPDGCSGGNACDGTSKLCVERLEVGADCKGSLDCKSGNCQDTCREAGLVATTAICDG